MAEQLDFFRNPISEWTWKDWSRNMGQPDANILWFPDVYRYCIEDLNYKDGDVISVVTSDGYTEYLLEDNSLTRVGFNQYG